MLIPCIITFSDSPVFSYLISKPLFFYCCWNVICCVIKRGKEANLVTPMYCLLHCCRIVQLPGSPLLWISIWKEIFSLFSFFLFSFALRLTECETLLSCSLHWISLWTVPPVSEFNGYLCKCCSHCCEWIEVKLLEKMLKNTGADDEWHSTAGGVIQKWAPLKTSWF